MDVTLALARMNISLLFPYFPTIVQLEATTFSNLLVPFSIYQC
jgi:hypothetical protein